MKKKKSIAVSLITFGALTIILAIVFSANTNKKYETVNEAEKAQKAVSSAKESKAGQVSTESPTQAEKEDTSEKKKQNTEKTEAAEEKKEPEVSAPDSLIETLSDSDRKLDELSELGCGQLITVNSDGSDAKIDFYTLNDGKWTLEEDLSCQGFVGSNGVTTEMHEDSYASPVGLYHVGDAFYIYEKPETGLESFEITEDTYWVDDPDSKFYNRKVEGTENQDWKSAEHMIDYADAYEYGFVIDYNTEAKYNEGSAVFFHISSVPTAGCVGVDRDMVLSYLKRLDSSENPYILIL